VGIFGSGVLDVIPRLLAAFHQARPGAHSAAQPDQGRATAGAARTQNHHWLQPAGACRTWHGVQTVLKEALVVGCRPRTGCASATRSHCPSSTASLILYPNLSLHGLAQEVSNAFHREGLRLNVAQSVEDVLTCVALVAGGFGACITTRSATSLRLPGVEYRPLHSPPLA
jgi:DNA-binding transcriptional LysR family regulator